METFSALLGICAGNSPVTDVDWRKLDIIHSLNGFSPVQHQAII